MTTSTKCERVNKTRRSKLFACEMLSMGYGAVWRTEQNTHRSGTQLHPVESVCSANIRHVAGNRLHMNDNVAAPGSNSLPTGLPYQLKNDDMFCPRLVSAALDVLFLYFTTVAAYIKQHVGVTVSYDSSASWTEEPRGIFIWNIKLFTEAELMSLSNSFVILKTHQ